MDHMPSGDGQGSPQDLPPEIPVTMPPPPMIPAATPPPIAATTLSPIAATTPPAMPAKLPPPMPEVEPGERKGGGFFRGCATYSWMAVVATFAWSLTMASSGAKAPASRAEALGTAVIPGLLFLSGFLAGIVALCGIPRHGRKGLLLPALTGMCIWIGLILLAVPNFMLARKKAMAIREAMAKPVTLGPVKHITSAESFRDDALGIAFDVPDGFAPIAHEKLGSGGHDYGFVKRDETALARILLVKMMKTEVKHEALRPGLEPKSMKDQGATFQTFRWRGVDVNGGRIPEVIGGVRFVTFNVEIPLRKRAMQMIFSGRADSEEETRAWVAQVLDSVQGETNW